MINLWSEHIHTTYGKDAVTQKLITIIYDIGIKCIYSYYN